MGGCVCGGGGGGGAGPRGVGRGGEGSRGAPCCLSLRGHGSLAVAPVAPGCPERLLVRGPRPSRRGRTTQAGKKLNFSMSAARASNVNGTRIALMPSSRSRHATVAKSPVNRRFQKYSWGGGSGGGGVLRQLGLSVSTWRENLQLLWAAD